MRSLRVIAFLLRPLTYSVAVWCMFGSAFAQIPDFYREPGLYPNREYVNQNVAEYIDPFTGGVKLSHVDIHIPGNGGFDIDVRRNYTNPQSLVPQSGPYGIGWTMHFGRVLRGGGSLCTNPDALSTIDNPVIELTDGTSKLLYAVSGTTPIEWITADYWRARCDATGQMRVYSPEGTEYTIESNGRHEGSDGSTLVFYATRITDKIGNYMNIVYTSQGVLTRLDSVNAFDYNGANQRTVTYNYGTHSSGNPYLTSIVANGFTWTYTVEPVLNYPSAFHLRQVTRPGTDTSSWQYTYYGAAGTGAAGTGASGAPGAYSLQQLRYPTGGTINYSYAFLNQFDPGDLNANNTVVTSKITAGGQNNGSWTFSYLPGDSYDETTVTTPIGTEKYRHFGLRAANASGAGNLWKVGLLLRKEIQQTSVTALVETYSWTNQQISAESYYRKIGLTTLYDPVGYAPLLGSKIITRDAGTYTTTYSSFDTYGNPATVTEAGPGGTKTTGLTYCVNVSKWLVRATASQTISTSYAGALGSITRSMDPTYCRPNTETRFGVATTFGYSGAGDLTSETDANTKVTNYSNHWRGVPQTETRPDGPSITRIVSNAGNVTQETIGEGTRSYSYDGLNRLTGITFPKAGSSAASISYPTATSRTLTRGGYSETLTYDGFKRATVLNRGGITVSTTYDSLGRKIFESYPGSASGMTYTLDVLSRIKTISQPNPTGSGTVTRTFTFGASNITLVNERNNTETQTFGVYANPDERFLTGISYTSLTAANLSISTNDLGLTTSAVQGGKTRSYGYNTKYFLTSEVHPETGTTTYGRDNVGNMTSKQVGAQPASSYTYDGSNRLKTAAYTGGTIVAPNVAYTYWNDGKAKSVAHTSGESLITRNFTYDANRNLQTDNSTLDSLTFTATYGYDGNDQLSSITYPRTGTVVSYAPNALGRPTLANAVNGATAVPVASSVVFYPSGQLQSFTRANGVTESLGQNTRQMTSSVAMNAGATPLASQGYTYDAGGNLVGQTDADTAYALTLGYDAVDRVNAVNGGVISYDGAGNLTAQTLPGAGSYAYAYDASNRLQTLSGAVSRSFSYDGYGNVSGNGLGTFTYDSASNLRQASMTAPAAAFSYLYDGKNQRARSIKDSGYPLYSFHALNGDLLLDYDAATGKMAEYIYLAGRQIARLDHSAATVQVSLASSVPGVAPGQAFNLVATVDGGASGTVTFTEGATTLGTASVVGTTATLALPAGLPAGTHTITGRYNGDAKHAPAVVALVIVI